MAAPIVVDSNERLEGVTSQGSAPREARGSDGASTRSFALLRRASPRQPALILAQVLQPFGALEFGHFEKRHPDGGRP
jgi:hypothetical protein